MAVRSHQQYHTHELPPYSAPTPDNLVPYPVFEFSNDPDLDLDVAVLSHWAHLPTYDLDELYPNLPSLPPAFTPSHTVQSTEVNYVQSPSLARTYTLSPSAAILHLQCLPDHAFAGAAHLGTQAFFVGPDADHMPTHPLHTHITPPLHTPPDAHIITPNAEPSALTSAMSALQQHFVPSADKFKRTARILGGGCLSDPNHIEDQLFIKPNGLALESVNHLMSSSLIPDLVPGSPTSGASNPRNMNSYTSAPFDSSALVAGSSLSAPDTSPSSTYYESSLYHLQWNRMNGAIPLSPTPSVNKIDTMLREEMSFTSDDGSEVTFRVKTENLTLEDGFTWRKYGRKEIKKKTFKKSYLKCARYDKGCKVLKRIQRCSDDQDYIDFTYTGRHNHPA